MLDEDQRAAEPTAAEATTHAPDPEATSPEPETRQTDKAQAEGETGEAAAEPEAPAEPEERPEEGKAKPPAWMQRRIDELTRNRHEAERRAAAAEAELQRYREPEGADPTAQQQAERQVQRENPGLTQEQVRVAALQLRAQERFDETCNTTFEKGKEQFPDFEKAVGEFRQLGGLPRDFLEDVLEAGNAHATLHHLGTNLDEADRIMTMQPRQRMAALARLSDKLAAPPPPKPISRAPAPVDPVGGAGRPSALNTDPDSLSTAEWMRRRNAGEIK